MYSGFIAEALSRKYAILVSTAIFIIGVVIQTTGITSSGSSSILGGRFITGMGVGALSMIVPMYNAEVAPPEVRGALVGLQQLAITFGILISFWIDCKFTCQTVSYYILTSLQTVPTTLEAPVPARRMPLGSSLFACSSFPPSSSSSV